MLLFLFRAPKGSDEDDDDGYFLISYFWLYSSRLTSHSSPLYTLLAELRVNLYLSSIVPTLYFCSRSRVYGDCWKTFEYKGEKMKREREKKKRRNCCLTGDYKNCEFIFLFSFQSWDLCKGCISLKHLTSREKNIINAFDIRKSCKCWYLSIIWLQCNVDKVTNNKSLLISSILIHLHRQ